jgi:hypothetical protein
MRNNWRSPLGLVAAFVVGALALTPFVSRAEPALTDPSSGDVVFVPNNPALFVVRGNGGVYLFEIEVLKKNDKYIRRFVQLDYKPLR